MTYTLPLREFGYGSVEAMSKKERLSFEDLETDVIDRGICAMCRGCTTFCSADALNALTIKEDRPVFLNEDACLKCGICYMICPRTEDLEEALRKRYGYEAPIGQYMEVGSLRSTNMKIRSVCSDGGVVTGLLKYMLDVGTIDGAVICRKEGLWNKQPMLATTFEDLLEGAGTSMAVSASVEDLGEYTTYVPTLLAIRSLRASDLTRVAFVGTPCQIKTLRKMQLLQIVPAHIVRFTIGLFCYENFQFTEDGLRQLEEKIDAPLSDVTKINVKEDFIVRLGDGSTTHIDLEELCDLVRPECVPCTDFSNYASDVSVGGLGSPDGYTTTMIRSLRAKSLIEEAIAKGYLERNDEVDERTMIKKIEDMARRKHDRGMSKLKKLGIDWTY